MRKPAKSGLLVRTKGVYNEWNLGLFGFVDVVFSQNIEHTRGDLSGGECDAYTHCVKFTSGRTRGIVIEMIR